LTGKDKFFINTLDRKGTHQKTEGKE